MNLSRIFRARRAYVGITQREAAKKSGMSVDTWNRVEREHVIRPSFDTLERMAEALDCELTVTLTPLTDDGDERRKGEK